MAEGIGGVESGERGGSAELAVTLTMGALAIAVVAAGIAAATSGWTSVSDVALIELRVRDVPAHLPLVGVYSRYGWNHPGPAEFYGLAPFYRLFGGASVGLLVGALVFQFGSVIAALVAVRRFDTTAALAVAAGAIAAFLGMPPEALRSPWNPYVSLGGVVALVAFGWAFAQRRRSGALALVAIASVMAQTHVVSAPIAAAVVAAAMALALVSAGQDRPVPWPWLGGGVALAALVWLAPIVQQFTGSPGNLGEVLSAGSGDDPAVGFGAALQAFTGAFALVPSSLDRGNVIGFGDPLDWHVPLWLAVVVAGGAVAWRDRRTVWVRGWSIAAAATLGSVVSIALVTGTAFGYLRIGLRASSLLWLAISAAPLVALTIERLVPEGGRLGTGSDARPLTRSVVRSGVRSGVVVAAAALALVTAAGANPDAGAGEGTETLAEAAEAVRRSEGVGLDDPVEISHSVDFGASLYGPAMMVDLDRRGWNVQSEHMGEALVGAHRVGEASVLEFRVVALGEVEAYRSDGWELAGAYEPFGEDDLEALAALDERFGVDGTFSLEFDPETAERQAELAAAKREITGGRVPAALVWRHLA